MLAKKIAEAKTIVEKKPVSKLVAYVTTHNNEYPDLDSVRNHLKSKLPDYFLPHSIIPVKDLPRSDTGKIQRNHIQDYSWEKISVEHPESEFTEDDFFGASTEYVAPSSEYEKLLADIWCDVLAIEDISVHDNFVEVGGDSLLSIRILARINKAGLTIAPEDFFEFPTISQQAVCLEKAQANSILEGNPEGTFELIPIQKWFFQRIKNNQHHWNQNCLLRIDESLEYVALERTIQKLVLHHDVLRSVFVQSDGVLQQHVSVFDGSLPLELVDFSDLRNNGELEEAIDSCARNINASFDLTDGPLTNFLFIKTAKGQANRLLITLHHLLVDAQSWLLLIEDLTQCWESLNKQIDFKFSAKTSAFKLWSEKLVEYADSETISRELDFWVNNYSAESSSLPFDFQWTQDINVEETTQLVSSEHTFDDINLFCVNNDTDVQTLLIAALVLTLGEYSQSNHLLLDIEGHGREPLFEQVDVSRTLGWFTTVFPVVFDLALNPIGAEFFNHVRTTIKSVPNKGIGHGILRELSVIEALKQGQQPQVCFNYLGKTDSQSKSTSSSSVINMERMNFAQPRAANSSRAFVFEINCIANEDKLSVIWSFSDKIHTKKTVEMLSSKFMQNIDALLRLNTFVESKENDAQFDLSELDESELGSLSDLLDEMDDD